MAGFSDLIKSYPARLFGGRENESSAIERPEQEQHQHSVVDSALHTAHTVFDLAESAENLVGGHNLGHAAPVVNGGMGVYHLARAMNAKNGQERFDNLGEAQLDMASSIPVAGPVIGGLRSFADLILAPTVGKTSGQLIGEMEHDHVEHNMSIAPDKILGTDVPLGALL